MQERDFANNKTPFHPDVHIHVYLVVLTLENDQI